MADFFSVQNILLVVVALMQVGQWVQRQLHSDVSLAEKMDALGKRLASAEEMMHREYLLRDVYNSDQKAVERRLTSVERRVFNGGYKHGGVE